MDYKIVVTHENGVITSAGIQVVFASGVEDVKIGVDIEKALTLFKPGDAVPYSKLPYKTESRMTVTGADGLKRWYAVGSVIVVEMADIDTEDLLQNPGKYIVKKDKLVIDSSWQEPVWYVPDVSSLHGARPATTAIA